MVKLGEYLSARLYEAGLRDVFGVAGDFVLGLLNDVVGSELNLVPCCNELNSAYAADGYARLTGLGAVITTHAVGELSAINGIAGSFCESVPVIMIVGVPATNFYNSQPLLHHTLGDYYAPMHMYQKITVANTILNDRLTAPAEIDRCIKACLTHKKPVYIAVPADMVTADVEEIGSWIAPQEPPSKPDVLAEAVQEIYTKIKHAKKPLFLPGVEILRRGLADQFRQLIEVSGIPYTTMLLSKGLLSETHPNFIGLYSGARSRPAVRDYVESSDCLVIIGERLTDFNTGGFTLPMDQPDKRIIIEWDHIIVKHHQYWGVYVGAIMGALLEKCKADNPGGEYKYPVASQGCVHRRNKGEDYPPEKKLTMHSFFSRLAQYIPDEAVVVAETGSSLFSACEMMLPDSAVFIGQTFYGSIGFSVGAAFGAAIASKHHNPKQRKVILIVGDGSFQLTCQEVSSMIRYGTNVQIFLINNDGYLIERVITDNVYNDIQMWKYAKLPSIFGGEEGRVVHTHKDLTEALQWSDQSKTGFSFLEITLDKWDCNQLLKSAGRLMAKNNALPPPDIQEIATHDSSSCLCQAGSEEGDNGDDAAGDKKTQQ